MTTYQEKIIKSFKDLIKQNENDEINEDTLTELLSKIVHLAVEEERKQNITSKINGEVNNIIDLFE